MGRMSLGQMRTQVELRQPSNATGSYGRTKPTYATAATVMAHVNVRQFAESETRIGGIPITTAERLVVIHYRTDITEEWQVRVGGEDWSITGINDPDGANEILELTCIDAEA